jgi:hypothetical protein
MDHGGFLDSLVFDPGFAVNSELTCAWLEAFVREFGQPTLAALQAKNTPSNIHGDE